VEYIEDIKEANLGTRTSCISQGTNNAPLFKKMFISFGTMITRFRRGCKPFIGIDGCFLKGSYKGVLLIAMALDANNGYFPLAYEIVEMENKDNWASFLRTLRIYLDGMDLSTHTFISERHNVCQNDSFYVVIYVKYICFVFCQFPLN